MLCEQIASLPLGEIRLDQIDVRQRRILYHGRRTRFPVLEPRFSCLPTAYMKSRRWGRQADRQRSHLARLERSLGGDRAGMPETLDRIARSERSDRAATQIARAWLSTGDGAGLQRAGTLRFQRVEADADFALRRVKDIVTAPSANRASPSYRAGYPMGEARTSRAGHCWRRCVAQAGRGGQPRRRSLDDEDGRWTRADRHRPIRRRTTCW